MKNLSSYKNIHFIGVLGSSMRLLADFSSRLNISVSGSDKSVKHSNELGQNILTKPNFSLDELRKVELGVYSSAIPPTHPELLYLNALGVECVSRGEFLARFAELFNVTLAISGTHGKTTVTAMIGDILSSYKLNPCIHLGGDYVRGLDFDTKYFVCEACEYQKNFLSLTPDVGIILNTDHDHPDCYPTPESVLSVYLEFAKKVKSNGILICPNDFPAPSKNVIKLDCSLQAQNIRQEKGYFSFTPIVDGKILPDITLSVLGEHNVYNALFALGAISALNLPLPPACKVLSAFQGVGRRFERITLAHGVEVISDYAHHPTEIAASIKTAKLLGKPLSVYFQPHTYSRTKAFFENFVNVLRESENLTIIKEYSAREDKSSGSTAYELFYALRPYLPCRYADLSLGRKLIKEELGDKTVLILGAGDINTIIT